MQQNGRSGSDWWNEAEYQDQLGRTNGRSRSYWWNKMIDQDQNDG